MNDYRQISMAKVVALCVVEFVVVVGVALLANPVQWAFVALGPVIGFIAVNSGLLYKSKKP